MTSNEFGSVHDAFESFERDVVRVPKHENDHAKRLHPAIRSYVADHLAEHEETFLSGSYGRRVQAVKLKDIDVIVVLRDPDGRFAASSGAALDAIRSAARGSDLVRSAEKRHRSVRLTLHDHEFTVDLVAAMEPSAGATGLLLARHLPDEGLDDWTLGHPRGQLKAASAKNDQTGGIYVPAVRIVKYWLGTVWGEKRPFRSYHAESVLYGALADEVTFDEAMVLFFDAAYEALAPHSRTPDPGAPHTSVDERLESGERAEAREAVGRARQSAHAAFDKDDVGAALDAWVNVFGSAFPAPSTSTERVAASMAAGTAGAVGAGIRADRGRPIIKARPWRKL